MKDNCIICMVIGKRCKSQYDALKASLRAYANKCNADVKLITDLPDKSMKRSILAQKLLIPSMFLNYERIAFLDLDIIINKDAPNIFTENTNSAFSACVSPRSSIGYKNTCRYVWNRPKILEESNLSYFTDRGFPSNEALNHTINGGVMLMNPNLIGELFRDAYHSDLPTVSNEEPIAAYISQINDFFEPLDDRYNAQVIHELSSELGLAFRSTQTKYFSLLKKFHRHAPSILHNKFYPSSYREFIARLVEKSYIIHFAGNYPYLALRHN